jgi:hypothetical protein
MTEEEARQNAIVRQTDIQNSLIANVESDIHIVKHKIDDMKEEYRQFDDDAEFADRLEALYGELGSLISKRDAVKHFAFNEPLQTNTSHRNPSWVLGDLEDDEGAMKMTSIGYDAELDRLNKDL